MSVCVCGGGGGGGGGGEASPPASKLMRCVTYILTTSLFESENEHAKTPLHESDVIEQDTTNYINFCDKQPHQN